MTTNENSGPIVDPRTWNTPAVVTGGLIAASVLSVVFYFEEKGAINQRFSDEAALSTKRSNATNRRIDSMVTSINDLTGLVKELAEVKKTVVGKTPEGMHRRDCQDLVQQIQISIGSELASRAYDQRNFSANTAILRALQRVDCYDLQGFKSRLASKWRATVTHGK